MPNQENDNIDIPEEQHSKPIQLGAEKVNFDEILEEYKTLKELSQDKQRKKAWKKYSEDQALKPYQAELIKLQNHLEKKNKKMIILFEGRDAAGKGGTIRRVTRYMNEKRYRVVALGKPTDKEKNEWFYQKYISHFPTGAEH